MQVDDCDGITIRDYTDEYPWLPSTFSSEDESLPWNADLNKKIDVYDAVLCAEGDSAMSTTASQLPARRRQLRALSGPLLRLLPLESGDRDWPL